MSAVKPHLDWAGLVDYWAGDLTSEDSAACEEHVFGCQACSELSARVAAVTETLRTLVPLVLTPELLAQLRARGLSIADNPMQPGERREVLFPARADILLNRLCGLSLERATRVDFVMRAESTGAVLVAEDDVPFDRAHGSVLIACQKHFAVLPPDTVAEVRVRDADGGDTLTTYTILHRF